MCWKAASPPDRVSRKLVLIGTSAAGPARPQDHADTIRAMPGVEIHAQVLESILTEAVLSQPNYAIGADCFGGARAGRR